MSNTWTKLIQSRPKKAGSYLVVLHHQDTGRNNVSVLWFDGSTFSGGDFGLYVTHWMNLPGLPSDTSVHTVVKNILINYKETAFK